MKKKFKVEKLQLETLIDLLINLYENGIDYVDLSSDSSDPAQDKLIIQTRDSYININWLKGEARETEFIKNDNDDDDEEDEYIEDESSSKPSSTIEIQKLTDEDLNELL